MMASEKARGDWPRLLAAAGMGDEFLGRRHSPCPLCGGTDRYRFVDRNEGLWVCNHCTLGKYGNGLTLLQRWLDLHDAREAAAWVHQHYEGGSAKVPQRPPRVIATGDDMDPLLRAKRVTKMLTVWREAATVREGDAVHRYLQRRVPTLRSIPAGIRHHPALPYWDATGDRPILVGAFPAMVVLGRNAAGEVVQLHKTYLTAEGTKANVPHPKKTDVGVGSNSFALRLMPCEGDHLGVAEGIETALAAHVLRGVPVWACHSASVLARFEVPETLKLRRVTIFADSDPPRQMPDGSWRAAGPDAAAALAQSLSAVGVRTIIVRPARNGQDMADLVAHA